MEKIKNINIPGYYEDALIPLKNVWKFNESDIISYETKSIKIFDQDVISTEFVIRCKEPE